MPPKRKGGAVLAEAEPPTKRQLRSRAVDISTPKERPSPGKRTHKSAKPQDAHGLGRQASEGVEWPKHVQKASQRRAEDTSPSQRGGTEDALIPVTDLLHGIRADDNEDDGPASSPEMTEMSILTYREQGSNNRNNCVLVGTGNTIPEDHPKRHVQKMEVAIFSRPTNPTSLPLCLGSPASPEGHSVGVISASHDVLSPDGHTSSITSEGLEILPQPLHHCLFAQRRAILNALRHPSCLFSTNVGDPSTNQTAAQQLMNLLLGTVTRAEGNSCLILGPRGSGKSQLVQACLDKLDRKVIILQLSGFVQSTDRQALRELGVQLLEQTGSSLLLNSEPLDGAGIYDQGDGEDEANPFLESADVGETATVMLPPSSHLHTLIPVLSALRRPILVILDAFDLFALQPRQSLLYCLLDAAQNCRASPDTGGIAVIGMATRIDTVQLLEKRVKSRFSGRIIRLAPPNTLEYWTKLIGNILNPTVPDIKEAYRQEWTDRWTSKVNAFLANKNTRAILNETFGITRDVRVLNRILTPLALRLRPGEPYPSPFALSSLIESQRSRSRFSSLQELPYPALCLLIAAAHADTAGHTTFTFETLYDNFRKQVRASTSAPVQVRGGGIGMFRCTRAMLLSAFEHLIAGGLFAPAVALLPTIAREFRRYRCLVARDALKKAIEKSAHVNLKKWLHQAQ